MNDPSPLTNKVLILGAPRTGFALLLNILGELWRVPFENESSTQRTVNILLHPLGECLYTAILQFFQRHYPAEDVIFNQTFRSLLGGPRWLDPQNTDNACVRKYIGVKDVGDMTLNIYLPKHTLFYHDRVHSHYYPKTWVNDTEFSRLIKFASMRNPFGTLYSVAHSINAITGEYINRHLGGREADLRVKFAKFRLSDIELVDGLVKHLISYLKEFSAVKNHFHTVKWEDIIQKPAETIHGIAVARGVDMDKTAAQAIWDKIGYKNLTGDHGYNFKKDRTKGSVDDWKNYLTNQHLELFRDHGVEEFLEAFGYDKLRLIDKGKYTPFQQEVSSALDSGRQITDGLEDKNLQIFNWNKSNVTVTSHEFKRFEKLSYSVIERASYKDLEILEQFAAYIDQVMAGINDIIDTAYRHFSETEPDYAAWKGVCREFSRDHRAFFSDFGTDIAQLFDQKMSIIESICKP